LGELPPSLLSLDENLSVQVAKSGATGNINVQYFKQDCNTDLVE